MNNLSCFIRESLAGTLNQTLSYTYNNDFMVDSFIYAGTTESYLYDNDGLLIGAGAFTIIRNIDNGLPESVSDGTTTVSRSFNGHGDVESINTTVGINTASSWSVTRDDTGRIITKAETVGGTTTNYSYTYDDMGRLLTVTKGGILVEEYQYDITGTRIYEMNSQRGIAGRSMAYDDEDHLLTNGDATYVYDLDGFLTSKIVGAEITTYDYSSRGELLSVDLAGTRLVEYLHDPLGRRIAKKVDGVVTEKYLWSGQTQLLAVYDASDNLLMRFEYTDTRMPVAMTAGGTIYYLAYDQVGSLKAVVDSSGNMVKEMKYDTFGNVIADSNPLFEIPFGFAGGLYDRDVGLIRFGYRDYDPDIGRWTAKDPILFEGGDTDLYGYVQNNPINLVDPMGLLTVGDVTGAAATVATEAARQAGKIGASAATSIGIVTAPLGDLISPKLAGERDWRPMEDILHDRKIAELLKGWTELGKEYEEMCRQTGGCNFDPDPCK